MIRDKIVFSTEIPALKERLLCEPKLDLQKAVDISRSSELAHKEFVTMKGADKTDDKVEVDALNTDRPNKGRTPKVANKANIEDETPTVKEDEVVEDVESHTLETSAQLGEKHA